MKPRMEICLLLFLFACTNHTSFTENSQSNQRIPQIEIQIEGKSQKGFLIGMEPFLDQNDYMSEDTFYQIMKPYFSYAKKEEVFFAERTIVILPEDIGTWLVVSNEKKNLFKKNTIREAFEELAFDHFIRFVWIYFFEKRYTPDWLKETSFRMKAWQMAETYQIVFSRLASEFSVDIVAGSIVLPEPKVIEGKITVTDGPLQNVSFYFHSNGSIDSKISRKTFLTEEEKTFLGKTETIENPIFKTPFGLLYVLIGADSWNSQAYKNPNLNSVEIVAVPSRHVSSDAWKKYSQASSKEINNLLSGMSVFFNGNIWEKYSNGAALIQHKGKQVNVKRKKDGEIGVIYALGI